MSQRPCVYLTGYARTGKTTLLTELKGRNWLVVSSSEILHKVTEKVLKEFNPELYDKYMAIPDKDADLAYRKGKPISKRDMLIMVAEEILVPMFGREIFALGVAKAAASGLEGHHVGCIIESIGGEELSLIASHKPHKGYHSFHVVHTHTDGINHAGDKREIPMTSEPIRTQTSTGRWLPIACIVRTLYEITGIIDYKWSGEYWEASVSTPNGTLDFGCSGELRIREDATMLMEDLLESRQLGGV